MSEELKPCPFCGSQAKYEESADHHGEFFELGCPDTECPAHWTYYTVAIEDAAECIDKWNTRPSPEELAALRERVKVLEAGVDHIREYWNQDMNEQTMHDALHHILNECDDLLQGQGGER